MCVDSCIASRRHHHNDNSFRQQDPPPHQPPQTERVSTRYRRATSEMSEEEAAAADVAAEDHPAAEDHRGRRAAGPEQSSKRRRVRRDRAETGSLVFSVCLFVYAGGQLVHSRTLPCFIRSVARPFVCFSMRPLVRKLSHSLGQKCNGGRLLRK